MNHNEKNLRYSVGEIVFFMFITDALYRHYGQRVYRATGNVNVITQEEYDDEDKLIIPEHNSCGMIIGSCFMPKHGVGTRYYKVLFGENLLWVAERHLSAFAQPAKNISYE